MAILCLMATFTCMGKYLLRVSNERRKEREKENANDWTWASDDSWDLILWICGPRAKERKRMHMYGRQTIVCVYTTFNRIYAVQFSFSATNVIKMLLRHNKIFLCAFHSYYLLPGSRQQQVFMCLLLSVSTKLISTLLHYISWAWK